MALPHNAIAMYCRGVAIAMGKELRPGKEANALHTDGITLNKAGIIV